MADVAPTPIGLPTLPPPQPVVPSDLAIAGGPMALRDGNLVELTRYQQSGTVRVDGDTVTQQIGRGQTAEYSLSQLAAHSHDPEMFVATMRYASDHGDSVKIDVHHGVAHLTDPGLEARLPHDFPFRDVTMRAAVTHWLDPRILGAVGMQESGMGKGADYDPVTKLGADGHGHGMWQWTIASRRSTQWLNASAPGTIRYLPPTPPLICSRSKSQETGATLASNGTTATIQTFRTRTLSTDAWRQSSSRCSNNSEN